MFAEPTVTEIVYEIPDETQTKMLRDHFTFSFSHGSDGLFEFKGNTWRALSNIPEHSCNVISGYPEEDIDTACKFFGDMPFIWIFDGDVSPAFKEKLLIQGFHDAGIFRGVIGALDLEIDTPDVPDGCTLELVTSYAAMEEFAEIACTVFNMNNLAGELYKKSLWEDSEMLHWIGRKGGKAVSVVSTLIQGELVSFWNGASLPEVRCQGINTALRKLALKTAIAKGCRIGASYLNPERMAFGICSKLGYQTKWQYHAFASP